MINAVSFLLSASYYWVCIGRIWPQSIFICLVVKRKTTKVCHLNTEPHTGANLLLCQYRTPFGIPSISTPPYCKLIMNRYSTVCIIPFTLVRYGKPWIQHHMMIKYWYVGWRLYKQPQWNMTASQHHPEKKKIHQLHFKAMDSFHHEEEKKIPSSTFLQS